MSTARSPFDTALDLLVYAPLGVALHVQQDLPGLVQRGRQAVTTQGAMYRAVGEFAVDQVKQRAEKHAGGVYDLLTSVGLIDRVADGEGTDEPHEPADADSSDTAEASAASDPPGTSGEASDATADTISAEDLAIADYDTLPASHIVPLLGELDVTEQEAVSRYEAAHRARRTILGRLERLAEQRSDQSGPEAGR